MPAFNGPLNHSDPTAMLVELAAHGVRGIGIFNDVSERNSLSSAVRSSPYLAYMCNDDKLYVYDGPRNSVSGLTDKRQSVSNTDWQNTSNWTEVGAEANDLTSSVTWTDVPSANITEVSVTQHEAALSISQGQVLNLTGAGGTLDNLQSQITGNGSDITANATAISTNTTSVSNNAGSISGNTTAISNNANDIATNTSDIATNTSSISGNTTSIGTLNTTVSGNTADISTNTTSIGALNTTVSGHTTDIGTLNTTVSGHTTDIGNNATAISTNATAISGNTTDIGTNTTSIGTLNTTVSGLSTDIATNTTSIGTNATAISGNTTDIGTLNTTVSGHTTDIGNNASSISSNTSAISSNTSAIASNVTSINGNTTNIATNTTNIAANTVSISANSTGITTNANAIADNTTHRGLTNNPHATSILNLTDTPSSFGSHKNVLTVNQNTDGLEYSDLIEEITNEVLDLVNSSSSYTQNTADLNGDGIVGMADLLILLQQYGSSGSTNFQAAWKLDDSDSSLPYTGSGNESNDTSAPSDSNTNLLFLEAPSQVSSYTPWTITTNTNNETVTIAQSNGDSAEIVEYSKKIEFIDPLVITIQQTVNTSNIYNFFLKTVYSYPTASDLTVWYNIGEISFANANYSANGSDAIDKTLFGTENILDFFDHESGSEHPSSATMSFRYMKTVQEGDSYVKLKNVNFQWKS